MRYTYPCILTPEPEAAGAAVTLPLVDRKDPLAPR